MNTVTINSNVYRGAEQYANLHSKRPKMNLVI